MYAPVMITTYSRLDHLRQTIEALRRNVLADQTTVFVYVDGPRPGDENKVDAVKSYLATVDGFLAFNVIERWQNLGAHENAKLANYEILQKFGALIRMEDDIVSAPGFLTYMNAALEKYRNNKRVFSVSAYCPPIRIPQGYSSDVFFLRRFNGWGCGIWLDRLESVYRPISVDEFDRFSANKEQVRAFVNGGGKDMLRMLREVAHGRLDAGDISAMYYQFLNDQYTVYPTQSLVQNIGFDGSGVHCGSSSQFDVALSGKLSFNLPDQVFSDARIVRANRKFRDKVRTMSRMYALLDRLGVRGWFQGEQRG